MNEFTVELEAKINEKLWRGYKVSEMGKILMLRVTSVIYSSKHRIIIVIR